MPRWIELVELKPNGDVRPCLGTSALMRADDHWNTDSLHAAALELIDRERPIRPYVVGYDVLTTDLTAPPTASVRLPRVRVREHVSGQHVVGYLVGYAPTGYHVLEDGTRVVRYADYADADAEVIWND